MPGVNTKISSMTGCFPFYIFCCNLEEFEFPLSLFDVYWIDASAGWLPM